MLSRSSRTAILGAFVMTLGLIGRASAQTEEQPLQYRLYGFVNGELERVQATGGATAYGARFRVSDGNSRLGFAGSYQVAPAVKALWQIEGSLGAFEQGGTNDKGASAILVSRNTFVGIEEEHAGRLLVGYNDSVYRSLVGSGSELGGNLGLTTLGLDLWNNTSAQVSGNPDSVFSRGEARYKNSVHYLSPDWLLRFGASFGADEAVGNGRRRDRFALAARLKAAGFQLGVGFDRQGNTGANTDQLQQGLGVRLDGEPGVATYYLKAVASYTAPTRTFLALGWERSSTGFAQFIPASDSTPYAQTKTGSMRQDAVMVSLAQGFGSFTAMASAGRLGKLSGSLFFPGAQYGATQLSLGAKYDFNEHFATYVYGTAIDNKAQQSANLGQAPLYSNAAGTSDAYLAPGNSPRAAGLGLIARFF